jgi:hypothetical protein
LAADRDAVGAAAIAVERAAAAELAAAGTADTMWPSGEMAQELLDRRVGNTRAGRGGKIVEWAWGISPHRGRNSLSLSWAPRPR